MKHLLPLLLLSLNSFSQAPSVGRTLTIHPGRNGDNDTLSFDIRMRPKIDTIRAELLVTFTSSRWGVAHARGGYVVMNGSEVVKYLDCRHREIKQPAMVWGWVRKGGGR